jgi:hypothetical protein
MVLNQHIDRQTTMVMVVSPLVIVAKFTDEVALLNSFIAVLNYKLRTSKIF